jgi:hypothetical protein
MPELDSRTIIYLPFNEPEDEVRPTDVAGTLIDMGGDSGSSPALVVPSVTDGLITKARAFTTDKALISTGDDSDILTRDVCIEALAELDTPTTNGTYILCCRGVSGSAAERRLFGLQLVITGAPSSPLYTLQAFWEEQSGAQATVPGKQFSFPTGFVYFAASRRWVSISDVRVEYFVNGISLGEVISIDGDIEGGTAGSFTAGCRGDGGGDYENFWEGPIDWLRISDEARSAQEVRQINSEITELRQRGYDLARALLPVGKNVYSQDSDSVIQRELKVEGSGLRLALQKVRTLADDFYPDKAWAHLVDWERITQLFALPGDLIETRRNRILSFLRKVHGYSVEKVKEALEATFDLDASLIQILEYSNLYTDDFTTAQAAFWQSIPGPGTITIVSDELEINLASATNAQWELQNAIHNRLSIDGDVVHDADPSDGVDITIKLSSAYALADDVFVGLMAYNGVTRDLLILGVSTQSGTDEVVWRKYENGSWGSLTVLETPAPGPPMWVRMRYDGTPNWSVFWSDTGPDDITNETAITGIDDPTWVGIGMLSFIASPSGTSGQQFDDWRALMPNGLRVWNWYAYRDQSEPGTPDIPGAQKVVQAIKPAHTQAAAVEVSVILCDDPESMCDDGPLA